jgi:hypothetical protein
MRDLLMCAALTVAVLGATIMSMAGSRDSFVPIIFAENAKAAGIEFILKNHVSPEKRQIEAMPAGVGVIDYNNDG